MPKKSKIKDFNKVKYLFPVELNLIIDFIILYKTRFI